MEESSTGGKPQPVALNGVQESEERKAEPKQTETPGAVYFTEIKPIDPKSSSKLRAKPTDAKPAEDKSSVETKPGEAGKLVEMVSPASPAKLQKDKSKKFCNIVIPAALPDEEGVVSDRIRLGICAMNKKARSKPMANILSRLDPKLFRVVFFGDDVIVNQPVEDWPVCDVLIAFYSTGKDINHGCVVSL